MARGSEWEAEIARWLEQLNKKQMIHTMRATEAPMRVIRGRPIRMSKGMLDFEGGWRGIHLALDAKEINEPRFNFRSKIKEHQTERMRACLTTGGASGILVRFADHGVAYGLHAREIIRMMNAGTKSVKYSDVVGQGGMGIECADDLEAFCNETTRLALWRNGG